MKKRGRLQNSALNLFSGFAYRIFLMITAFVVRTVFIKCLSADYLGINGLYSNILSMLSLAELGFGSAMVYSMYKPLAESDYRKLSQIIKLYKKVYRIIGTIILIAGLCLVPFLDLLIKNKPDVDGLTFYYILFLLNTVVSYWFFAYYTSILNADQKSYVLSGYDSFFSCVKALVQICVLLIFHMYTLYLLTEIITTIIKNIIVAIRVKHEYPLDEDEVDKLPSDEVKKIFKDVKALMLSKISHVILNSTDNLIISAFVGLNYVALLSNYLMITEAITGILTQITNAIQASLGNFFVEESKEAGYKLFKRVSFLNYWLYGFSAIAFIVLLNPFITVWIGKEYLLSFETVIAIAVNFYIAGFMNTLWTFRSTLGLFTQGQYRPIIVAILNVALSIGLSFKFGITGVLAATAISRACVNLWYDPWLLHAKGFDKPVGKFFVDYLFRLVLIIGIAAAMKLLAIKIIFVNGISMSSFVAMTLITGILPNLTLILFYHKSEEFRYFCNLFLHLLKKIKR